MLLLLNLGPARRIPWAIIMLMAAALLLLPAGAFCAQEGSQSQVIRLDPRATSQQLGPFLQLLQDSGAPVGIEQAASPAYAARFAANPRQTLYLRPSPYPLWVRFSFMASAKQDLDQPPDIWHLGLIGPTGQVRCALYIPLSAWPDPPPRMHRQGGWLIQEIGWPGGGMDARGRVDRRTLLLPSPQEPVMAYLSMQVSHDQYLPLEVMPGRVLVPDNSMRGLLLGLALGVLAGLMAYNLSVFFILRDTAYLYYLPTVLVMGLISFSEVGGFSAHWYSGVAISVKTRIGYLLLLGGNLAYLLFIMRFFRLKERGSWLHRVLLWLLWLQCAMTPLYAFLPLAILGPMASGFLVVRQVLFWTVIIQGMSQKVAGARAYAIGYAMLVISIWSYWLSYFGLVPYHSGFVYALPMGAVFEALFFSLALHFRLDDLRRKEETARENYIDLLVKSQHRQERLHEYGLLLQKAARQNPEQDASRTDEDPGLLQELDELKGSRARLTKKQRELELSLEEKNEALAQANAALKVLFERLTEEKAGVEEGVSQTVRKLVMPALERLKASRLGGSQREYVHMLETALNELAGRSITTLASAQANLTPAEAQVALLIREGKASKEIAEVLNLSEHTVAAHRKSIRAKLGLAGKPVNLAAHLRQLA